MHKHYHDTGSMVLMDSGGQKEEIASMGRGKITKVSMVSEANRTNQRPPMACLNGVSDCLFQFLKDSLIE